MKKQYILFLIILLSSCDKKIETELVGKWIQKENKNNELIITKNNNKIYLQRRKGDIQLRLEKDRLILVDYPDISFLVKGDLIYLTGLSGRVYTYQKDE